MKEISVIRISTSVNHIYNANELGFTGGTIFISTVLDLKLKTLNMEVDNSNEQFTFKAWIEEKGSEGGLKLHVHGEVQVSDESLVYQLDKKDQQGYFPDELFLEIKPEPVRGDKKVEIKYHEDLSDDKQFKKITIFAKTVEVYQVTDIKVKND